MKTIWWSYSAIKTNFFNKINDATRGYWLNKSITSLWRIAFHVGQCSRTCSTVSLVWDAQHWGGLFLFNRCPCVKKVCPIRSRWMMISSRRGSRYDLVMFTVGSIARSMFSVLRLHDDCHWLRTKFWPMGSSQSKLRPSCWLAWVGLLLQQCRLPRYRPGRRDSEPT